MIWTVAQSIYRSSPFRLMGSTVWVVWPIWQIVWQVIIDVCAKRATLVEWKRNGDWFSHCSANANIRQLKTIWFSLIFPDFLFLVCLVLMSLLLPLFSFVDISDTVCYLLVGNPTEEDGEIASNEVAALYICPPLLAFFRFFLFTFISQQRVTRLYAGKFLVEASFIIFLIYDI